MFGDVADTAASTAKAFVKSFGVAESTAQSLLANTGDLLTGFGFTDQAALDMAKSVNELAADLASFSNIEGGVNRASRALTSALLGEREAVKSLGISILETDVKEKVLENTAKGLRFETLRQAKAFATLQIAQVQSAKAIGDVERTWTSTANTAKRFAETTKSLREGFGRLLIDTLKVGELMASLDSIVKRVDSTIRSLSEGQQLLIVGLLSLAIAFGPVLVGVALLVKFGGVLIAFLAGALPIILSVSAAILAMGAAFVNATGEGETFGERLRDVFKGITKNIGASIDTAIGTAKLMLIEFKFAFRQIGNLASVLFSNQKAQFINFGENIGIVLEFISTNWEKIFVAIGTISKNFFTASKNSFVTFGENIGTTLEALSRDWAKTFQKMGNITVKTTKFMGGLFESLGFRIFQFLANPKGGFKFGKLREDLIRDFGKLAGDIKLELGGLKLKDTNFFKDLTKGVEDIGIPELKLKGLDPKDLRDPAAEAIAIEEEKILAKAKALRGVAESSVGEIVQGAIDKFREGADKIADAAEAPSRSTQFAGALERGTVAAASAELAGGKIDSRIEKNTKKSAENSDKIAERLLKLDATLERSFQVQEITLLA